MKEPVYAVFDTVYRANPHAWTIQAGTIFKVQKVAIDNSARVRLDPNGEFWGYWAMFGSENVMSTCEIDFYLDIERAQKDMIRLLFSAIEEHERQGQALRDKLNKTALGEIPVQEYGRHRERLDPTQFAKDILARYPTVIAHLKDAEQS